MKSKITFISSLFLATVLTSCSNKFASYPEDIVGTWVCIAVDGEEVETDLLFTYTFDSQKKCVLGESLQVENGATWAVYKYDYWVEKGVLHEERSDESGYHRTKSDISFNGDLMYYKTYYFESAGEIIDDSHTYTLKRVKNDLSSLLIGMWGGRETTPGVTSQYDTYWEYLADGTYNYYYYDTDQEKYVKKEDNEGKYYLYGDFFVSVYTNDLLSGGTGPAYECWFIDTDGSKMTWKGLRSNGKTTSFSMTKVSGIEKF